MFSPKLSHELTLNRLVRYLKQIKDRGLVLNINYDVCKVDGYPDVYFSGMYGHEEPTDTACVKRRTVFIIKFVDYIVLWVSKL